MKSRPLPPDILKNDHLDARKVSQGHWGDCAFVVTIKAAMGTDTGREFLLQGVREDPNGGYQVRLWDKGKPEWVAVKAALGEGVTTDGVPGGVGIPALYEAALLQRFGAVPVNGTSIQDIAEKILDRSTTGSSAVNIDTAVKGGNPVIALSINPPGNTSRVMPVVIRSGPGPDALAWSAQIPCGHGYEVLEVTPTQVVLRNPAGKDNRFDGAATNSSGGFYIDRSDYYGLFWGQVEIH